MKLIYIAGPFSAPNAWQRAVNVHEAERLALRVAECGAMPVCPHSLGEHMWGTLPEEFWCAGTLELLRACDAMVLVDGWPTSKGSCSEKAWCDAHQVPVFAASSLPGALTQWIRNMKVEA